MIKIKIKGLKEATEKELEHPAKKVDSVVIQHNVDFFNDNQNLRDMITYNTNAPLEKIVSRIEPFRMNKIVKYLGGGAMGKAFEIDNGHVVKVFRHGVDPQDDIKMYREAYQKMHTGKATKFTLPVFYFNEVSKQDLDAKQNLYYAEIAKVEPLNYYIGDRPDRKHTPGRDKSKDWTGKWTRSEVADFLIRFFVETVNRGGTRRSKVDLNLRDLVGQKHFIDKFLSHINEFGDEMKIKAQYELFKKENIDQYIDDIKNYKTMSRVEIRNLIKSLLQMHMEGRNLADAGARNLGVSLQGREHDPIFYIFDK